MFLANLPIRLPYLTDLEWYKETVIGGNTAPHWRLIPPISVDRYDEHTPGNTARTQKLSSDPSMPDRSPPTTTEVPQNWQHSKMVPDEQMCTWNIPENIF